MNHGFAGLENLGPLQIIVGGAEWTAMGQLKLILPTQGRR